MDAEIEHAIRIHGFPAPGVVLGVLMAKLGLELIKDARSIGIICETWLCVPTGIEAVCMSRGLRVRFRVENYKKLAATFYDRRTGHGYRIFLDPEKTKPYLMYHSWYMRSSDKSIPKRERYERVIQEMLLAGEQVFQVMPVIVEEEPKDAEIGVICCRKCGEPFPTKGEEVCRACLTGRYYRLKK